MTLTWRDAALVRLRDGYAVSGPDGRMTQQLTDVRIAVEGGYLHIQVAGAKEVQLVSAPGVDRVTYPA